MRQVLTAAAVAALLGMVSAPSAQASCGDWLAGHGEQAADGADAANLPFGPQQQQPQAPAQPCPCNGPSCGNQSNAPLLPPPAHQPTTQRDHGAVLDPVPRHVDETARSRRFDPFASARRGFPQSIDRPPRG